MTTADFPMGEDDRPRSKREKRLRDQRIVAACRRGLGNPAIAELFGLTPQRVGQILRRADASLEPLSAVDAEREIRGALAGLDQVLEDFAAEFQRTSHGGYRIAAIRGRVEVLMLRLELQARAGLIPRSLAQPAQQAETAALLVEFMRVLERHNASDAMLRDALEVTERATGGRRALSTVSGAAA